jgi:DNA-binding NtrC family response regulator
MLDFKAAINTTLLVVDDDIKQLELRALVLTMSGFNVLKASNPLDAIAILAQQGRGSVDVAVLDYEMPGMNGCLLADYIKTRYPEMRVLLHSGRIDIPMRDMANVDGFVAKGEGIDRLLDEVFLLCHADCDRDDLFGGETSAVALAVRSESRSRGRR